MHVGQIQQPVPGFDSMAYGNGQLFSTYDKDDAWSVSPYTASNGAHGAGGGWWFHALY